MNKNTIFEDGDPFEDPHWRKTPEPKRRSSRLIGCPVSWFAWVFPLAKSKEQLALALYLYRRCCVCRSDTVMVPTAELVELGPGNLTLEPDQHWARCPGSHQPNSSS